MEEKPTRPSSFPLPFRYLVLLRQKLSISASDRKNIFFKASKSMLWLRGCNPRICVFLGKNHILTQSGYCRRSAPLWDLLIPPWQLLQIIAPRSVIWKASGILQYFKNEIYSWRETNQHPSSSQAPADRHWLHRPLRQQSLRLIFARTYHMFDLPHITTKTNDNAWS